MKNGSTVRFFSSLTFGLLLLGLLAQTASAAILFQDDAFATIESDAIMIGSNDAGTKNTAVQFGADTTPANNGNILWNAVAGPNQYSFSVDHKVNITGGLTSDNAVDIGGTLGLTGDSPASSRNMLRKNATPNTAITGAACSALGEVIVNTTTNRVEICTTIGAAGTAVWSAPTTTIASGVTNPVVVCSLGDLFYNTATSLLEVCTAVTPVWSVVGPDTFETIYANDADKTLTTVNNPFTIDTGTGTFTVTSGTTDLTGSDASPTAISLTASNVAGGITGTWGTGGMNFSGPGGILNFNATGAFNVSGTGSSIVQTDTGNLNLTTTTSGDVALNSAGDVTFKDQNLISPLKMNDSQTALSATYTGAGDLGMLDALNALTLTTAGQGASLVGFDNSTFTNITGSDVQAALASIDSKIGSSGANVDTLTFNPQYPNYVISRSGGTNQGTLIADFDSTNKKQYFDWTTNQTSLQNIDVKFRFPLPTDFVSTGDFTLAYRTGTATTTNNKVAVAVTDVTKANALCGSSLTNASANVWATATVAAATLDAGCTGGNALAAGDLLEVDVKFYDVSDVTAPGTFADASQAALAYNN